MKHEPSCEASAIPMEKQLGWAHKWDAAVSGDLQGGSNSVSQLMGSQIWYQLASSVGGGFRKGATASACLDARHFKFHCMPLVPRD